MAIPEDFEIHNLFRYSLEEFITRDPQLRRIAKLPFSYVSSLIHEQSLKCPGIYLITGGRQIGKSTFLKQFILNLLESDFVKSENIFYLAGELIDNHHALIRVLENFCNPLVLQFLFIDEINYISDWDKGIKFLADAGYLDNTVVILTGSDSLILRTAMQRFAGRRGKQAQVDYTFYPLSYREFVKLKHPELSTLVEQFNMLNILEDNPLYSQAHPQFMELLQSYLIHGGYLPAIADYWQEKSIQPGTMRTYNEWIVGDMLKHKKSEKHTLEMLNGLLKTYASQISWNSLLKQLSIEHHQTVSDYCHLMSDLHIIYILEALNENTLTASPKKNKKIYFQDPFIYHSVSGLIQQDLNDAHILKTLANPEKVSALIEGIVISESMRHYSSFYLKGSQGEVDLAYILKNHFYPVEIKWTNQLRKEDLKQVQLYPNGIVLWNRGTNQMVNNTPIIPLPKYLLSLPVHHPVDQSF
jgi:predicted AAA+ superfamily ATPase